MSKRQLYIFVTSNSPDIYVNVLRHCIQNFELHKDVFFVGIFEDNDKQEDSEKYLNSVIKKTEEQIGNLAKGQYLNSKEKVPHTIEIEEHHMKRYAALLNLNLKSRPLLYKNIEIELKQYISNGIFDVSGFQKDYLVDIYTILHLLKNSNVFYFKIKKLKDRTYDDKELIHNLTLHTDYEFENISESPVTTDTRVIRNNAIEELSQIERKFAGLVDEWADSFAGMIINTFRVIVLLLLVMSFVVFYRNIGSWDKIEPLTVLPVPILYAVNIILHLITGKDIQSALTFATLKVFVKDWKKRKILNGDLWRISNKSA